MYFSSLLKGNLSADSESQLTRTVFFLDKIYVTVYSLMLGIFGIPGNALAMYILRRKTLRDNLMTTYLASLATFNLLILTVEMPRYFVLGLLDLNVMHYSFEICVIHEWFVLTFPTICNWLLVMIAAGRYLHLRFPEKSTRMFTSLNMYTTIMVLSIAVGSANYALLDREKPDEFRFFNVSSVHDRRCWHSPNAWKSVVFFLMFAGVPCLVISVVNLMTYVNVRRRVSIKLSLTRRHRNRNKNLALLLAVFNFQFVTTVLPIAAYRFSWLYFQPSFTRLDVEISFLIDSILTMMMYAGYATNCLVNCFFGSSFRREMCRYVAKNGLLPGRVQEDFQTTASYAMTSPSRVISAMSEYGGHASVQKQSPSPSKILDQPAKSSVRVSQVVTFHGDPV